ncbi:MucR family transcriptional regulator [Gordonia iterans]
MTGSEPVRGVLACDGAHVQCHECGDWYRSLTTHIRLAHGMSDDEYRYEWDLPAATRLASDDVRNTARANAMQRVDRAGPLAVPRFLPGTYVEGGAVAAEYDDRARRLWTERLQAAGWASWEAAVDWAVEHDKTWSDIAARLGITHQQARTVGMAHGVVLPPLWQRMVVVARDHVDRYGTLLNTTGRLSAWLSRTRHESQTKRLPRRAVAALDRLDPDWRLDREARRGAMRRRKVANGHQVSSFRTFDAQVRAAGFEGAAGLLRHGIVEHLGPSELGDLVGVRGDSLLKRMTVGNPENPFDATEELCSSVFGMLDDDGSRVQCHECGLWFGVLYRHLTWHTGDDGGPLSAEAYRKRHGLPADLPLRSDGAPETLSGQWDAHLQEAGFASWEDALAAMAQDHLGLSELGERLGVRGDALPAVLAREAPGDPWAATEPFRVSRFGHLEDDGERSQCHECGLWYRRVGSHVSAHSGDDGEPLTFDEYRARPRGRAGAAARRE